jgi:hypothetical protein
MFVVRNTINQMRATVKNAPIAGGRRGRLSMSLRLFEMIILHPAPRLEDRMSETPTKDGDGNRLKLSKFVSQDRMRHTAKLDERSRKRKEPPCLPAGRTGRRKCPREGSSPMITQRDERSARRKQFTCKINVCCA